MGVHRFGLCAIAAALLLAPAALGAQRDERKAAPAAAPARPIPQSARPAFQPGRPALQPGLGRPASRADFRPQPGRASFAARPEPHLTHGAFHGHDFHHFTARELHAWRGGRWRHELHNGRLGWWWYTDGGWYFYDAPVYPFPTVVAEEVELDSDVPPPEPVEQEAPPQPLGPPPAISWYRCASPAGFYPAVQSCPGGWQAVSPPPNRH